MVGRRAETLNARAPRARAGRDGGAIPGAWTRLVHAQGGPGLRLYGVAVFTVVIACLLTVSLWPVRGQGTFLLFLASVAFSSWHGGVRPGILAALLSAAAGAYFFLPPHFSPLVTGAAPLLRLVEFVLVAALVVALNAAHYSARAKAEAARGEAEAANRVKDDFLASVSHELRTPLGVILGWVQALRHKDFDAGALQEVVDRIERNARAQSKLIEDLLDVSRLAGGNLRLDPVPLTLAPVVAEVVASLGPSAAEKGVTLVSRLDEGVGPVMADRARIEQVAYNLVTNAIKFTPAGGRVEVRVALSGGQARVVVSDTGDGISPEFLPHVFERFRQGGTPDKRAAGLGLGLSIVRQLVEMHGGSVTAESPGDGLGATFTVYLPIAAVARATAAAGAA